MQKQTSKNIAILERSGIKKSDMAGYWDFTVTQGSSVVDSSGHSNSLTLPHPKALDTRVAPGLAALSLSAKECAQITDAGSLRGLSPFTMNYWLKLRAYSIGGVSVLSKCGVAPFEYRLQFAPQTWLTIATEKIGWYKPGSSQMIWQGLDITTTTEQWSMFSVVFDGKSYKSYINGQPDSDTAAIETGAMNRTDSPILIGAEKAHNIPGFDGWMTELAILNRALTAGELGSLYGNYCSSYPCLAPPAAKPDGVVSIRSQSVKSLAGVDKEFENPGNQYRMCQYVMGGRANFDLLQKFGMGSAVLGLLKTTTRAYLHNEEAWAECLANLNDALDRGMGVWIYDEDGYPSGAAGGLTVDGHPEYCSIGVKQVVHMGKGRKAVNMALPEDAVKFVNAVMYPVKKGQIDFQHGTLAPFTTSSIQTDGLDGEWALCAYISVKMLGHPERRNWWLNNGEYPNLLNADACQRYIEVTHDAYKRRFGSRFRKLTAFYTGEPSLATVANFEFSPPSRPEGEAYLPWDDAFAKAFEADHGYDIRQCMAALYVKNTDDGAIIRHHYWQTVANVLEKNFFGAIAKWCDKNGGGLSGHLLLEEYMIDHVSLYGDFLQQMACFHIPGYDHYYYRHGIDQGHNLMMGRYSFARSRAQGNRKAQALIEPILSGYLDSARGKLHLIPISVHRSNLSMMIASGANIVNSYVNYHDYPVDEFKRLNDYVGRMCYFTADAQDITKVGMYYPIESFQARSHATELSVFAAPNNPDIKKLQDRQNAIGQELFKRDISFNILDAWAVGKARVVNGTLQIAGYEYEAMIMPDMDIIPLAVLEKLKRFEDGGGVLIWAGKLPTMGSTDAETPQVTKLMARVASVRDLKRITDHVGKLGDCGLAVKAEKPELFYYFGYRKRIDGRMRSLNIMVNNHNTTNVVTVNNKGTGRLYDPWKGEYASVTLPLSVGIGAYSAMVLVMD